MIIIVHNFILYFGSNKSALVSYFRNIKLIPLFNSASSKLRINLV